MFCCVTMAYLSCQGVYRRWTPWMQKGNKFLLIQCKKKKINTPYLSSKAPETNSLKHLSTATERPCKDAIIKKRNKCIRNCSKTVCQHTAGMLNRLFQDVSENFQVLPRTDIWCIQECKQLANIFLFLERKTTGLTRIVSSSLTLQYFIRQYICTRFRTCQLDTRS